MKKDDINHQLVQNDREVKISEIEGVYSPKIDHLFIDFPEGGIDELSGDQNMNLPLQMRIKAMDLKKL